MAISFLSINDEQFEEICRQLILDENLGAVAIVQIPRKSNSRSTRWRTPIPRQAERVGA